MHFFIAGITGHVGGAAATELLAQGHALRALVRDPAKAAAWAARGVEVRRGAFEDSAAVADAIAGTDGAFLMMPPIMAPHPDHRESKAVVASLAAAVRATPPRKLVVLSSIGSEQPHGLGNITQTMLLERALADAPFPTAYVRAASFLENYAHGLARAAETGVFDTFLIPTSLPIYTIASADIGRTVARVLGETWTGRRVLELGSPTSADDLARAMGDVLGRPVTARSIPRERWTQALEAMGLPPGRTGAFEEMEDGFNSGWITFGRPGAERVPGTITPAQFFAR